MSTIDAMPPLFFPEKPEWEVQAMRLVAQAEFGGADLFECLRAAREIVAQGGDETSWRDSWSRLASRLLEDEPAAELGVGRSAETSGERAARACNYFRTAEFFAP